MEKEKNIVMVYAESTPNPAAMKFVVNQYLLEEGSVEYLNPESAANCPLALELFRFDGVASVFVTSNFVTVNKKKEYDWFELMPVFREFIKGYIQAGDPVFTGAMEQKADPAIENTKTGSAVETRIIEALEEYVKPAVEQDGGAIHFKSFNDGKVTLLMKGSCSGCPSSSVTLKGGIERLLLQLVPEVKEVVAEEA